VALSDGEIAKKIEEIFDMTPYGIETRLKLRTPMYSETAAYGHMGRKNETVRKIFIGANGESKTIDVELFTWEKLDYIETIKQSFNI
jgi:S-adenosylmethionine synthetase